MSSCINSAPEYVCNNGVGGSEYDDERVRSINVKAFRKRYDDNEDDTAEDDEVAKEDRELARHYFCFV